MYLLILLALAMAVCSHAASTHRGYVRFGGLPIAGAVIRAMQGDKELRTFTDSQGAYSFSYLMEGSWTFQVEMSGFAPLRRDLTIVPDAGATVWELTMLPLADMNTQFPLQSEENAADRSPLTAASPPLVIPNGTHNVAETLLINGSVNNGESRVFGNNRRRGPPLYTADLNLTANNSAFDARSFSLTGQNTPKPTYNRSEASLILDGPLTLVRDGPRLTLIYSRTQNRDVRVQAARFPTPAERSGDFSAEAIPVVDPSTGLQFAGNVIPPDRISPQARALLSLYPLPNFTSEDRYNYQVAIMGGTHRDNFQLQTGASVWGQQFAGSFGFQRARTDSPNLFGFDDNPRNSAVNGTLNWSGRLAEDLFATAGYAFRRTVAQTLPYFANRVNVSGDAGITGNAQDPRNWGPPNLNFSRGIAPLFDGQHAYDRTQSSTFSQNAAWSRGLHALSFGATFRRQQFNLLSELDARGTFTFTGAASGLDFADFLLGLPAASSISFGNADRYFRQSGYDAFVMDDWRVAKSLTLNLGIRWEYEAPVTERYGRLVNLDITPGFEAASPVLASEPRGSLSGRIYPESLVDPDKRGLQPRIGVAWRPGATSSVVVRAGYGIYRDPNVYRSIAGEMAQQFPFSTRLSLGNSTLTSLTLANGFITPLLAVPNTFAVDPEFRVAYAQNWQLSLQHDMPGAVQITATYLGIKGTHLQERTLPNTFPSGGTAPCACQLGYVYLTSNGTSVQHVGTIQIRRRQRNGLAASLEYSWSKAIDDAGLGGFHIAQDWRNRRGERALSNFDQRHRMMVHASYTTSGFGVLLGGRMGTLLRGWTVMTDWRVSSGSPLTPTVVASVPGTGVTGILRPDRTGVRLQAGATDTLFNPAAFSLAPEGQWGNAGRNSIPGSGQFALDASIGRTFSATEGAEIDLRVDFTNVLNRVSFASWDTTLNSVHFGLPTSANSMRTIRPSLQVRF
ncbi:MAG TPA: TonB-dependent receptor [Terriglobia bacterium]|nr:TonB-dependent receptor [Terriglobia bacterium]